MSTALITGASSGIGLDIARQLAARGLNLILVARRKELLDQLADELAAGHGITTTALACDLADRQSLGALFDDVDATLAKHNEHLTVLVNNAGTGFWAPFADQDLGGPAAGYRPQRHRAHHPQPRLYQPRPRPRATQLSDERGLHGRHPAHAPIRHLLRH